MENKTTKAEKAQGAESAKKQQKVSASYTVTALGQHIEKLKTLGLLENDEETILKTTHAKIAKRWIAKTMGIEI